MTMKRKQQRRRLRVAVLMGGWSHERSVSFMSGETMFAHVAPERYEKRAVQICADGALKLLPPGVAPATAAWRAARRMTLTEGFAALQHWGVDAVVLALHGAGGEDGVLQGFLETLGIPYTHSGVRGSAAAIDKVISKQVYLACGIPTPACRVVTPDDGLAALSGGSLAFPLVVKSPCLGSSYGVHIVDAPAALQRAVRQLWKIEPRVLIERYIDGRECTCAVLERRYGAPAEALPVTEIVPVSSTYFDFKAKYTKGASREITPAEIAPRIARRIQAIAVRCHQALQCESVSRTDFRLSPAGAVFALETNTIPGMTGTSLLPQAAAVAGISFAELLDMMIDYAVQRAAKARRSP